MEIKYLPTGHIFDLPKEECKRIYKESPFNYEVLNGAFNAEDEKPKSTVASKVLGEDAGEETPNKKMNFEALKKIAIEKGIKEEQLVDKNGKNIKKDDLIKLIENFVSETKTEKDAGEEEVEEEE